MDSGGCLKRRNLTRITDLDIDSLCQCASYLSVADLSNKLFKTAAYSNFVWNPLFRDKWHEEMLHQYLPGRQVREAYLARRRAIMNFSFVDPLVADFYTYPVPFSHLLLGKDEIIFSQGSNIQMLKIDNFIKGKDSLVSLRGHDAKVTCMRLFPFSEASFTKTETKSNDDLLVTSSCDNSIRLWCKGSCLRSYKGHHGTVSTLSDKLLGDEGSRLIASGGEDGTVRLWSLSSSGKHDQLILSETLHGNGKPVQFVTVSGHKSTLLVSVVTDPKCMSSQIRVWDSTLASSSRTSTYVGMASVPGPPRGIKCFESMLYMASGHSVHALDLRTMKKSLTVANCSRLFAFDVLPSRSLLCTLVQVKITALLWDIRKNQGQKPDPIAELVGCRWSRWSCDNGPVTYVHMDPYKIVTSATFDLYTNVFNVESGILVNALNWCDQEPWDTSVGYRCCNTVALDGSRIVTGGCVGDGIIRFRDFDFPNTIISFLIQIHECNAPIFSLRWIPSRLARYL